MIMKDGERNHDHPSWSTNTHSNQTRISSIPEDVIAQQGNWLFSHAILLLVLSPLHRSRQTHYKDFEWSAGMCLCSSSARILISICFISTWPLSLLLLFSIFYLKPLSTLFSIQLPPLSFLHIPCPSSLPPTAPKHRRETQSPQFRRSHGTMLD